MAIRQVLLNGVGTSGNGTTWNDLSDATSAYIGVAGLIAAINASTAGDIVFVKGTGTYATSTLMSGTGTQIKPIRIYGCKSTTTNNQGSIVTSDLIPGLATGNSTPAYDDIGIPTCTMTGTSADWWLAGNQYWYGVSFYGVDDISIGNAINIRQILEECKITTEGASDNIYLGTTIPSSTVYMLNCYMSGPGYISAYNAYIEGGKVSSTATDNIMLTDRISINTSKWRGVDFSASISTNLISYSSQTAASPIFMNCRFPASINIVGSIIAPYRIELYGCTNASGLTTGSSVRESSLYSPEGAMVTETVKIRTGGADDGASGSYSWDMTPTVGVGSRNSLVSHWMHIWVEGDGTAKTVTVYFTSDSANTNTSNWNNDEVWIQIFYPDDGGTANYDHKDTQAFPLSTPTAVTTDGTSTWGAGTARNQKLSASIAPDYSGIIAVRVHFNGGGIADTIYVDPKPEVA